MTHNRPTLLNETLHHLFDKTDFKDFSNAYETEVFVINDHPKFQLDEDLMGKVGRMHLVRPPWMISNLAETHNRILVCGFGSLAVPQSEYVVHIHDDTFLHEHWVASLMDLHTEFSFVVGNLGDGIVSYTAEAVKRIGMWDEHFVGIQHKEADYYIRALQWNKEQSTVSDKLHCRFINPVDTGLGLSLNISEDDNSLDIDLAFEVAKYFRLNNTRANEIFNQVRDSVRQWRVISKGYSISSLEQDHMSRAFKATN